MAKEKVPWSAYDNLRAESIYGKLPIKPKGIHCKKYKNIKRAMLGRSFLSDELWVILLETFLVGSKLNSY